MHFSSSKPRPRGCFAYSMLAICIMLTGIYAWRVGSFKVQPKSQEVAEAPPYPVFLIEKRHYVLCDHITEQSSEFNTESGHFDPKEVAKLYNAAAYQLSSDKLYLYLDQPGLCPSCKENIFIGLCEDKVAVYYGMPGGPQQLKEQTQIPIRGLPLLALEDLKKGIPIQDGYELLYVLEGLMN